MLARAIAKSPWYRITLTAETGVCCAMTPEVETAQIPRTTAAAICLKERIISGSYVTRNQTSLQHNNAQGWDRFLFVGSTLISLQRVPQECRAFQGSPERRTREPPRCQMGTRHRNRKVSECVDRVYANRGITCFAY